MAEERVVKVTLSAQMQSYITGMEKAAQKTRETASEAQKLAQTREAFNTLGRAGIAMGAALALGVGVAFARFAEFDQAMSNVQAATHENAANMGALRDAALEAGAATVFSATESANAIEELAKAGVSTKDILGGGLKGSLDLAAAGGLAVADAAGIGATALKIFNLEGSQMSHVADLLAAGAGKAMGDVTDLSAALAQGGQVASATGLSIEETTAALSAFASQGLLGSDAGTSFKAMLQRLTPQSGEAAAKMDELGISAYDASGQFIGLEQFAGNLRESLQKLTPEQRNAALATIFGSDAVRAANILYEEGAEGIAKWTEAVNDQGYAAETAAIRLDNLNGDLEKLSGALDTALIQSGSGANDALRALVQTVTGAIDLFNGLPAPLQQAGVYLALVAAGVGLVGGAAILATPKIIEFRTAMATLGLSMRTIGIAAGGATLGIGALIAVVAAIATAQAEARARAEAYVDTLEAGTNRITKATRDMAKEALAAKNSFLWIQKDSAFDAAEKLGISLDLVTDAATGNAEALKELQAQIDAGFAADGSLAGAAVTIENAVKGQSASIEEAIKIAEQKQAADAETAETSETAADAYMREAQEAEGLTDALTDLINKINEANGVGQDAVTSNANYQAALAGITEEVEKQKQAYEDANGTLDGFTLSLDENTVGGSANASMLADVAGKAQDAALAQFEVDKSTMSAKDAADKYAATLADQRQKFIDSAVAAGYNKDEVQKLADKVFALPSSKEIEVLADTATASTNLEDLKTKLNSLPTERRINIGLYYPNGRAISDQQLADQFGIGFAAGGAIFGPGTSTSDSIPAMLSNGEHVLTAADVAAMGGQSAVYAWRKSLHSGQWRYSSGGAVGFMDGVGAPRFQMSPTVQVFIGDEEVTGRVRVVVKDEINQVARSALFGGGR